MELPRIIHPKTSGFTIIELVITLILIGILAITVLPKFFRGGFAEISLREQLLSRLHLVQTQAMNHYQDCFFLQVNTDNYFSGELSTDGSCANTSPPLEAVSYSSDLLVSQGTIRFDGMGRVRLADSSLCSQFPCVISVEGDDTHTIIIESEGYIHAPL
ncbi:prepilin-type N-terminal cleavage/methylation domain-containing protein [Agarivorans sp. B2Z047]|uniref:type II secretion system protein n=1 Tax=Agarivorans sp. B2Z047 TaxID=2652721 RepID=UPI00128DA73B|nr:type II secretion system protein [Agarivorans sp. B2Z047]MPW28389.1 prepilin-type N-terminal cleavage/methylation domain-containing protein [Agarivorans sp. B2Z047]UQN43789.1 type II secretion system GspH family protein [Agarivorans sp. B2Z047]